MHHKIGSPASPPNGGAALASVEPEGAAGFVRTTDQRTPVGTPGGIVPTEVVSLGTPVALPDGEQLPARPRPPPRDVFRGLHGPADTPKGRRGVGRRPEPGAAIDAMSRAIRSRLISAQEQVGDTLQPAEDVQLSVRRTPKAVRLEWPDGRGQEAASDLRGHRVVGGLLHVHMRATRSCRSRRSSLPPATARW